MSSLFSPRCNTHAFNRERLALERRERERERERERGGRERGEREFTVLSGACHEENLICKTTSHRTNETSNGDD